jgi:RNA polymerase sigma-70 factor (ECF subfamily)
LYIIKLTRGRKIFIKNLLTSGGVGASIEVRVYLVSDSEKVDAGDIELLVKASQGGDRGTFDALVRIYQRRTMEAAIRILGDANEAAEAVQSGFVKAYLNIGKLKEPKRFEVWLLRIVSNTAISQLRAAKRRLKEMRTVDLYEDKETISFADKKDCGELEKAIQQAMLKLSKKEAKAISLFGLEDLSQEQVAEIMDCSVEAVRWHVYRARQKLKVLLKEHIE